MYMCDSLVLYAVGKGAQEIGLRQTETLSSLLVLAADQRATKVRDGAPFMPL